jgi:hypothetical protein
MIHHTGFISITFFLDKTEGGLQGANGDVLGIITKVFGVPKVTLQSYGIIKK